jgi:molybdopterin-guanine dinucleotide biosynthesis protein A
MIFRGTQPVKTELLHRADQSEREPACTLVQDVETRFFGSVAGVLQFLVSRPNEQE